MLNKIQTQLIKEYSELQTKMNCFEFYVSLEYPQKQRKLIQWWQRIIEIAIRKSGEIYLSPADLQTIFTIHNLKPVPLEKVLQNLQKTSKIVWQRKKQAQNKTKQNNKGWLTNITSYIWKQNTQNTNKSGYKTLQLKQDEKIVPIKYINQMQTKIKERIIKQLQHEKSISFQYIFNHLKYQLPLGIHSIEYLLHNLEQDKWMIVDYAQNKKIIIHSSQQKQMANSKWIQIQKSKFVLKSAIELFQRKIQQRLKEQDKKLQEIKLIVEKDQNRAKKFLGEVRMMKKTTDQYHNRRKLLKQTLDQLQINQLNSITIDIMSQCQTIIQKTMIDATQIESVKDKHMDIAFSQRQFNKQLQAMANMDEKDIENEVQQMMAELQKERSRQKMGKIPQQLEKQQLKKMQQIKS